MADNDDQQFKMFCEFANGHLLSIPTTKPDGQQQSIEEAQRDQYNQLKKMVIFK